MIPAKQAHSMTETHLQLPLGERVKLVMDQLDARIQSASNQGRTRTSVWSERAVANEVMDRLQGLGYHVACSDQTRRITDEPGRIQIVVSW